MSKITIKKVGKQIIAKIGSKPYSVAGTPESYAKVKKLVESFNFENSDTIKNRIVTFFTPKASAKKNEISKAIKKEKTRVKSEVKREVSKKEAIDQIKEKIVNKELNEDDKAELKKLLEVNQAVEQPKADTSSQRRSGEH